MEIFFVAILGGAIYRARGAGLWQLPRPIWQVAFALAYGLAVGAPWWLAISVLVLTTAAVLTGHASYIDLGTVRAGALNAPADGRSDEWYGAWMPGSGYWRDFAGLAISGLLITAPSGIAFAAEGRTWQGIAILFSGVLKAVAYALGRFIPVADKLAVSEPLCGALLWGALSLIIGW